MINAAAPDVQALAPELVGPLLVQGADGYREEVAAFNLPVARRVDPGGLLRHGHAIGREPLAAAPTHP